MPPAPPPLDDASVRRRTRLQARRRAALHRAVQAAETAWSRGDRARALIATVEAGLLDPDHPRVTALLRDTQREWRGPWPALPTTTAGLLDAAPGTTAETPGPAIGPASWTVPTPAYRTPRFVTRTVSAGVAIAGHIALIVVAVYAVVQVVPVAEVAPSFIMQAPVMRGDVLPPPEDAETPPDDEPAPAPAAVIATTPLADLAYDDGVVRTVRPGRRRTVRGASRNGDDGAAPTTGSPGPRGRETGLVAGTMQVDRPPRLLRAVPPIYPAAAFDRGLEGVMVVVVQVVVNDNGRVVQTQVVDGAPELHQAARDAVAQWVYRPALRNGRRVPVSLAVSIAFDFR